MAPRLPYGSNCAAHWGLLYDRFGKERITIYELDGDRADGEFPATADPLFGFDFDARDRCTTCPASSRRRTRPDRQPFGRPVDVPVRPHLGVMGVAPAEPGRRSSIPPGPFGGNVDNWRFGPGATVYYPVFHEGAGFYVGDPHFAQGDGEICGTAIEASLDVRLRLDRRRAACRSTRPVLETATHWFTHGFGDDLDAAMRMAAEQMLELLVDRGGFTADEAYSLASVAVDLGVTQVVDGTLGCHAAVAKSIAGDLLSRRPATHDGLSGRLRPAERSSRWRRLPPRLAGEGGDVDGDAAAVARRRHGRRRRRRRPPHHRWPQIETEHGIVARQASTSAPVVSTHDDVGRACRPPGSRSRRPSRSPRRRRSSPARAPCGRRTASVRRP